MAANDSNAEEKPIEFVLIIATILKHRKLRRKEMLVLVGMAAADLIYGVGSLAGGITRIQLVFDGSWNNLKSSWQCMLYAQTIFYLLGKQCIGFMLFFVSFDRLFAIVFFDYYISLGLSYSFKILGILGAHTIVAAVVAFVSSYFQPAEQIYTANCISSWAVPRWYAVYGDGIASIGGFASVILYAIVMAVYVQRQKTAAAAAASYTAAKQKQMVRQSRLTVTLAILAVCTFFLHAIPFGIIAAMSVFDMGRATFGTYAGYLWTMVRVNSMINILIYLLRMKEIRRGMAALLTCSQLKEEQMEATKAVLKQRRIERANKGKEEAPEGQAVAEVHPNAAE